MKNGYLPAAIAGDWDSAKVAQFGRIDGPNSVPSDFVVEVVTAGLERSYFFQQSLAEGQSRL